MKYKIMTIAVASLLPLGFAASASASTTANHEVTFTVADARSISVAVLGDPEVAGVVDLGTVGTNEYWDPADGAEHVSVTFRATDATGASNKVNLNIQLREKNGENLGDAVAPQGLYLIANVGTLSPSASGSSGTPYVDQTVQALWSELNKEGGIDDTTFNVRYGLDTRSQTTTPGDFSYFILYSLTDYIAPTP
jgi:type 1 fimbria pilin